MTGGGGSLDHRRRLQLISQNPVMSLRRYRSSSTSRSRDDDDDADDDVSADEVDQLHQFTNDQQVV